MDLLNNIDKIHSTYLGLIRIKKNIGIDDAVNWSKKIILDNNSVILKKGKNWYVKNNDIIITINSYSYTIITAHKERNKI